MYAALRVWMGYWLFEGKNPALWGRLDNSLLIVIPAQAGIHGRKHLGNKVLGFPPARE